MDFINHTINWCKGEIFEGKLSLLFGAIIFIISFCYLKLGTTSHAKAMFWPLLVVALISISAGIYLLTTNSKRILEYPTKYGENQIVFVQAEKNRTEEFIGWYPKTQKILFVLMVAGMLCMIFSHSAIIRAIGIGLMLLSIYGFVLDHFSEERANIYHDEIIEHLVE